MATAADPTQPLASSGVGNYGSTNADNARKGFYTPGESDAPLSNEEVQLSRPQKEKCTCIACFMLGIIFVILALGIATTPAVVVTELKCQGIEVTSPIKGGDTILVAELTQCQKTPNISLVHQDGRTRINDITVFFTSCNNLLVHVTNFAYSLVEISTPIQWLLDQDQENYLLPNSQVGITLNISDTTNETLVVCMVNLRDHERLQKSMTVSERLDVVITKGK